MRVAWGPFAVDPMSLLLSALVVAAVLIASLGGLAGLVGLAEKRSELPGLLPRGILSIAAVSTNDLLWSVTAILLFAALAREKREKKASLVVSALIAVIALAAVGYLGRGTDLAVIASGEGATTDAGRIALALLAIGLGAIWLVESRNLLRSTASSLTTRVAASFALQVSVASVLLRIIAWLPDAAPEGAIQTMAIAALGVGALGALGSTRVTTFINALALARGGFVLLALLGGAQGRALFLLVVATGGIALLSLALAAEDLAGVGDAVRIESTPRRLGLLFGAFTACSLFPFPGSFAAFPLASALLTQGHTSIAIAAAGLVFLLALGSMRLVARAWELRGPRSAADDRIRGGGRLGLALALGATWAMTLSPSFVVELATRAALEMF